MVATHPAFPTLALDGKRIAANAVVIALHAAALMLLLAPISSPEPVAREDDVIPITIIERLPPPPLPPPPQTDVRVRPVATPLTPVRQIEVPPVPSEMTYDDGTEIAIPDIGPVVDTTFDTGAPTVQALVADRAPAPPYPPMAERRRQAGTVVLLVLVDAGGNPVQVDVEQSSGFKLLDDAAQKFVLARWHFQPAQKDGVAISAYARVPVNFVL